MNPVYQGDNGLLPGDPDSPQDSEGPPPVYEVYGCIVGLCAFGDDDRPGWGFNPLAPLENLLKDLTKSAIGSIGKLLSPILGMGRLTSKLMMLIMFNWLSGLFDNDDPKRKSVTESRGYTKHARERLALRRISEDMVEQTIQNGTKARGKKPGSWVYKTKKIWVVVNKDGDVISLGTKR